VSLGVVTASMAQPLPRPAGGDGPASGTAGQSARPPSASAVAREAPPALTLSLPDDGRIAAGEAGTGSVTFVGTATVIIRYERFTILTDPNFLHKGDHAHLGYGLSSPRLTAPAITIENLPPIDLVVLSHYHGDHFDQVVEARLDRKTPVVTTGHAAEQLRERGFTRAHALAKWQAVDVAKGGSRLKITAMPARHGPPVANRALPETMGSLLEFMSASGQPAYRTYISGDTLVFDELKDIPQRYPQIDLALLHLGGTRVLGVLVTMDAEQGVRALSLIRPDTAIPIHYNDYPVFKSPLDDFKRAVRQAGLESKVRYLSHGETYRFRGKPPP
jgi:L-ascorbate metabolism protein UlaG (beta-lactamase superfamily)